ncbi:unnamed protein product [Caenorhabditis angaria]|uniref:Serpentine receptor class gamma n=1 Tax=Caenorhabditis angaria TaxID=860376 RepID=A0A9P1N5R0_9PELO|nr:unnamed protein product [Caenorhabditis angaria]
MSFDWTNYTLALSPLLPYNTFYTNQPRVYMFQGTELIDLVFLSVTFVMAIAWMMFCCVCSKSKSAAKTLITITTSKILVNVIIRVTQVVTLLLIAYPSYTFLFFASSIETTLHYAFYLQYTSSVILYVKNPNGGHHHYFLALFFSLFLSLLNVNFDTFLHNAPFYLYEAIYIPMILLYIIRIVRSCKTFHLVAFMLISSPPLIFNAALTIMDLLYMIIGVSEVFPTSYVLMSNYRYKAFELKPICVMIAFLALIPDLKRSERNFL